MRTNHNNILTTMLLCIAALLNTTTVRADTLTLTSGDHLTGSLINVSSGLLSFRTTLAGRIFVPTEEVTQLSTSNFVVVALKDEQLLPGRIVTRDGGIYVITPDNDATTPIRLADVSGISSAPETFESKPIDTPKINASVAAGYKWREGTEDASGPFTQIDLDAKLKKVEVEASAELEYTEDADSFERFFDAEARIRPAGEAIIKPEVILELERDRNQGLDSRADITVGAASTLIDNDKQRLDGFAGVGVAIEEYDSDALRRDENKLPLPPPGESSLSDEDLNLNLAVRYTREWYLQSSIEKELILRPSLTDSGDLRAELKSTLSVPLSLGMQLQVNLDFNYDNQSPYRDIDNWNTSVGAAMRFDF